MLNILLIRHAETDFNKKDTGFFQPDKIQLNSRGEVQLGDLSKRLEGENWDKVYSSDLIRAKQTTEKIFGKSNKKIVFDKRLREYVHGSVSPESGEWKKKYDELLNSGLPREEIRPFGGENIWDFIKRIKSFLEDLEKQEGNIVIISHSGVNEAFINLSQRREKKDFLKIKQDNGCLNNLKYNENNWKIITINDTEHLENLKPKIDDYDNLENIYKKLVKFLKTEDISQDDLFAIGDLANNKMGTYKEIFRKYFSTPLEIVINLSNKEINKKWKIVHKFEDYSEYEIGEILSEKAKYKINLIIPNNFNDFILKRGAKKIILN